MFFSFTYITQNFRSLLSDTKKPLWSIAKGSPSAEPSVRKQYTQNTQHPLTHLSIKYNNKNVRSNQKTSTPFLFFNCQK